MLDAVENKVTPMMAQWLEAKQQHQDAILLFRMGDFYELFGEDAERAAPILELVLTCRDKDKNGLKMAGFPFHAAEGYITKLVALGNKVAICEQLEDPKSKKGIVKRGITEVVTPGTTLHFPETHSFSNFLVAIAHAQNTFALAVVDFLSSSFWVSAWESLEETKEELTRLLPKEIVYLSDDKLSEQCVHLVHSVLKSADRLRLEKRQSKSLLPEASASEKALQLLKEYVIDLKGAWPSHIKTPERTLKNSLQLDYATMQNLDLLPKEQNEHHTLWSYFCPPRTAMGRRALLKLIKAPLTDIVELNRRHDLVQELFDGKELRQTLVDELGTIFDLEKLVALAGAKKLGPLALQKFHSSLITVERLKNLSARLALGSSRLRLVLEELPSLDDLCSLLERALRDELPHDVKDGFIFKAGYHQELDELYELSLNGQQKLLELEKREQTEWQIPSLKVKFTRVFGYYIEVTKTHLSKVPAHYIRKQTIANGERFTSSELSDLEVKLNEAQSRIESLERTLFDELIGIVAKHAEPVLLVSKIISFIDLITCFAETAARFDLHRPKLLDACERLVKLTKVRHPMVEKICQERGILYVSSDIALSKDECLLALITGPNMAGKSTIMRAVALTQIMAQMGSFVPALNAELSIADAIFARVGAQDDLATGRSTFMVEMSETAQILRASTPFSLVLLDEIGRGTSTYDGVAIALAVAHYLHKQGVRTIFATHYHELTDLLENLKALKNFHVSVSENNQKIDFLYRLKPGSARRSFGVEVARLAGLPDEVIAHAFNELAKLEKKPENDSFVKQVPQPTLFALGERQKKQSPIIEELLKMDINRMTPLQALNKIAAWQVAYKKSSQQFLNIGSELHNN